MKRNVITICIIALISAACASNSAKEEWVTVKGNKFIAPDGSEMIFRGLCFSDPVKLVSEGQWNERYFEEDLYTDRPLRFFIAEIIREKALYLLDQEIPHGIAVAIKRYEETETLAEIDAEIICEKQSHKQIIIGKGGEMLKRIGHLARVSFQKVAQKKIYLNLFVRVKENWKNSPSYLNEIGYDGSEI